MSNVDDVTDFSEIQPGLSTDPLLWKVCRQYDSMKRNKSPWIQIYDYLARYILGRRNFMTQMELLPQDYFDSYLFDTTAISANHTLASSLVGALWPSGGKSFVVDLVPEMVDQINDTDEVRAYFAYVTKTIANVMDNPKCGFLTTLEEYMIDQGAFGTSGILVEENDDLHVPVSYRPISARDIFIDQNSKMQVDTVFIKRRLTLRQIALEYGTDSMDDGEVGDLDDYTNYKKYDVIVAIQPREDWDPNSEASTGFPISSVHLDYTRNKLLRHSGYREMPCFVGRFWHSLNELYGRCPGVVALPDIRELNQLRYDLICASEKLMFPPVSVIDGCIMGNGVVDLSAKGLNVVSVSGKMGNYSGKPIEQTIDVGNPQWAFTRLQDLIMQIKSHFFLDRILDLNNETRMTLGEANIRNMLRGQSLNTIYTRQEKEVLEPIIERTFNILLGKGLLGVAKGSLEESALLMQGIQPVYIPDQIIDRMMQGKDVYRVRFVSPASQIRNAQALQGITQTLQVAQEIAQIKPDVLDWIDEDITFRTLAQLSGAPVEMIRSTEQVTHMREQQAQQQQAMMQAQAMEQGSAAAKNLGQAQQAANNTEK